MGVTGTTCMIKKLKSHSRVKVIVG